MNVYGISVILKLDSLVSPLCSIIFKPTANALSIDFVYFWWS